MASTSSEVSIESVQMHKGCPRPKFMLLASLDNWGCIFKEFQVYAMSTKSCKLVQIYLNYHASDHSSKYCISIINPLYIWEIPTQVINGNP